MARLIELKDRVSDRLTLLGSGRLFVRILAGLLGLILLYYLIGAFWVHKIDDNPDFAPAEVPQGGSHAVAVAAALIEREVDHHSWTANDPFFLPGSMLDNMPNFQQGIIYALSRFGNALTEQLARARGTSAVDADADRAAGLLRYPGNIWLFNLDTSFAPTASSESQYRAALAALRVYNQHVAEGSATFERRADNLMNTLDRFVNDLGLVFGGDRPTPARPRRLPHQLLRRRHLLPDEGSALCLLPAAEGARPGLREGAGRAQSRPRMDADAGKCARGGRTAALGGAERRSVQSVRAQPPGRPGVSCCSACARNSAR